MRSSHGPLIRRIGIGIEVACMLGILGISSGRLKIPPEFPVNPLLGLRIGLGVGIASWLLGTLLIRAGRR